MKKWKEIWIILKTAAREWYGDNTFTLGASLAYYTLFAIAPIVFIAVTVAGLVVGQGQARAHFTHQIGSVVGKQVGEALDSLSHDIEVSGSSTFTTAASVVLLVVGATSVFVQLQDALNRVWGVRPNPNRPWYGVLKDRLWSFLLVLGIGVLLLLSLVITALLTALPDLWKLGELPGSFALWRVLNALVSLLLVTLLFAMMYKVLPDVEISWEDVWVGSAFTAVLFTAGKYLIGLYLGQGGLLSVYGAAGSMVVVLLWVFYSSQLLLFGAEFTQAYARYAGKPLRPARGAVCFRKESRSEPEQGGTQGECSSGS